MTDRYLITGATGFVGANLVRQLVNKKQNVNIIVRDKKLNFRLRDIASKLHIYEADLSKSRLDKVIDKIKPTIIYHLAAYGVPQYQADVDTMIDINIKGTLRLIDAVKRHPFRLFINTGTFSEYGVLNKPMKETDMLKPINDYGASKAAATLFVNKIAIREHLPIVTFRLFYVYGPYEVNRFVPNVILSAIQNTKLSGTQPTIVRDFIYIDDVIDAYFKARHAKLVPGSILNIGTGHQHTLKEAADIVFKLRKSRSNMVWGKYKMNRHIESERLEANISLAKKTLKWQPKHSLYQGLKKTLEWFQTNSHFYGKI